MLRLNEAEGYFGSAGHAAGHCIHAHPQVILPLHAKDCNCMTMAFSEWYPVPMTRVDMHCRSDLMVHMCNVCATDLSCILCIDACAHSSLSFVIVSMSVKPIKGLFHGIMHVIHKVKRFIVKWANWISNLPNLIEQKIIGFIHKIQNWLVHVIVEDPKMKKAETHSARSCHHVASKIKRTICTM